MLISRDTKSFLVSLKQLYEPLYIHTTGATDPPDPGWASGFAGLELGTHCRRNRRGEDLTVKMSLNLPLTGDQAGQLGLVDQRARIDIRL